MNIIEQRVAIQQRQVIREKIDPSSWSSSHPSLKFQEYQNREFKRKLHKIKSMFEYVTEEEVREALNAVKDNEVGLTWKN